MNKKLTFFSLLFILLFSACKKPKRQTEADNPYGLPNATQTGANVFACRVNGQKWIADEGIFHLRAGFMGDTLATSADRDTPNGFELIVLSVHQNAAEGMSYPFSNLSVALAEFSTNNYCGMQTGSVRRYFSISGTIKVSRLDKAARIMSGTFEFTAPRSDCNDTLRITDGRFDVRYQ